MSDATDVTNSQESPFASSLISLADLRQSRQLSVGDVAQKTRLSVKQIELLDAGRFAELPGTAFTMGAIRSYCKVLGVAAEPYLENVRGSYDAAQRGELLQSPDKISRNLPTRSAGGFEGSSSKGWWIASALLALCAIALFVIQPAALTSLVPRSAPSATTVTTPAATPAAPLNAGATTVPAATTASPLSPTDPSASPASSIAVDTPSVGAGEVTSTLQQGSALTQGAGSAAPSGPSAGGISNPAAVAAGSSGVANNPATTQDIAASLPKPTGQAKIEIATVRDAWVEIRDGSGALVTNRLFRAGSKETVSLTSTTGSVVIGSATGVTLHWNGNPIDLKPHTKDDVARMNLK